MTIHDAYMDFLKAEAFGGGMHLYVPSAGSPSLVTGWFSWTQQLNGPPWHSGIHNKYISAGILNLWVVVPFLFEAHL